MHTLPALPYNFNDLEPYFDEATMQLHHDKHHATYVEKLNAALADYPDLQTKSLTDLLLNLDQVPEEIRTAVKNHGGGHFNHSFFWQSLRKGEEENEPTGPIAEALAREFGDFATFKEKFKTDSLAVFGSGWVWLVQTKTGELKLLKQPNQDAPLSPGVSPLLGLDVWEHAYYLKYQNRRADYIDAFFHLINWDFVNQNFHQI